MLSPDPNDYLLMSDSDPAPNKWKARYEREKKARHQAEKLLEEKSSQLYEANQLLAKKVELESSKSQREEEKFASLFQYSNDGIILQDHRGKILDANKTICEILGVVHGELVGTDISKIPTRDSIRICIQALRKTIADGSARFECHLLDKNKQRVPVDISATRLRFGEQTIIQGIIRDISEQQKAARDLEVATKGAIKANESKSLFLATMSHEIRTPLNGVIGFTDLLLGTKLSKEQQEYVVLIKKSGDILLNIISDILDFSRIESGQLELEQIDFDLTECIEDVLDIHSQAASAKQVDLVYYIDPVISKQFHGDSARLKQILINLVSNGLKFTEHGAVSIEVKRQNKNFIQFTVSDTGIGMESGIQDQLFQPFMQADASTTRKYGGTGLGLAICKQLTEAMDGTISVNSKLGEGSQFMVTLPFQKAEQAQPLKNIPAHSLKGSRVFILDDNQINLNFLMARLQKWGCHVTPYSSPSEAVATLEDTVGEYDFILVDMLMPDMNGFDFGKALIKRRSKDLPPMILLTSSREVKRQEVLDTGFVDLIYKPVKEGILLESMLKVSGSRLKSLPVGSQLDVDHSDTAEIFALIVEDNIINAKLAKLLVERLGIIVHVAHNGEEALDVLVRNTFYSVIFMDMQMPVMDGIQATKKIRNEQEYERYESIPIIAMTANVLPEDEAKCIAAGMDGYITKPIDQAEVQNTLELYNII